MNDTDKNTLLDWIKLLIKSATTLARAVSFGNAETQKAAVENLYGIFENMKTYSDKLR